MSLTCRELAERIERMQPEAHPREVARLCLLLLTYTDNAAQLEDDDELVRLWQQMSIRLQASTDQHAAMTDELDELAHTDPSQFGMDQMWVLIRAIKVQSQVLQLYVGHATAEA
jgi:hypothetical protein